MHMLAMVEWRILSWLCMPFRCGDFNVIFELWMGFEEVRLGVADEERGEWNWAKFGHVRFRVLGCTRNIPNVHFVRLLSELLALSVSALKKKSENFVSMYVYPAVAGKFSCTERKQNFFFKLSQIFTLLDIFTSVFMTWVCNYGRKRCFFRRRNVRAVIFHRKWLTICECSSAI